MRLTNLSGDDHTYTLGGQALSEITENGYFTQHSKNWVNQGISLIFSANTLRVPATIERLRDRHGDPSG